MNDYKKMIKELRDFSYMLTNAQKAADAIEQLVRDNNVLTKERDSAVEDLKEICLERYLPAACDYCNKHGKQVCKHCDWEWRGVQE